MSIYIITPTEAVHESDDGSLWADASSIGLSPGQWPEDVLFYGERFFRGPFVYNPHRELTHVVYLNHSGKLFTVHND